MYYQQPSQEMKLTDFYIVINPLTNTSLFFTFSLTLSFPQIIAGCVVWENDLRLDGKGNLAKAMAGLDLTQCDTYD